LKRITTNYGEFREQDLPLASEATPNYYTRQRGLPKISFKSSSQIRKSNSGRINFII
jgi:hypothetical protein